jgi:hypothetical protein
VEKGGGWLRKQPLGEMPKSREHMTCQYVLFPRLDYRFELLLCEPDSATLLCCCLPTRDKERHLARLHTVPLNEHPTQSYSLPPLSYHCLTSTLVPLLVSSSALAPHSPLLREFVSMLGRGTLCHGINSLLFQFAVVQETYNQCSHNEQA